MTISILLLGLLIASFIFASLGWSLARAFQTDGHTRIAHLSLAALILLAMAVISLEWPLLGRVIGGLLILAATGTTYLETGWSRLLPAIGILFGIVMLLGLPFAG